MLTFYLLCLVIAGLVAAQSRNQSVDLYVPGYNQDDILAASVISVNSDAAVYQVACPSGAVPASATANLVKRQASSEQPSRARASASPSQGSSQVDDSPQCVFPTPITITQGPSTLKFDFTVSSVDVSIFVDCKLASSTNVLTQAVCTGTQSGAGADQPGIQTATLNGTDLPQAVAVRVTAGAEKLEALSTGTSTMTTSQSSATTSRSGSGTITPGPTGGSTTSSAPATTTSSAGIVSVPGAFKLAMSVLGIGMTLFLL